MAPAKQVLREIRTFANRQKEVRPIDAINPNLVGGKQMYTIL